MIPRGFSRILPEACASGVWVRDTPALETKGQLERQCSECAGRTKLQSAKRSMCGGSRGSQSGPFSSQEGCCICVRAKGKESPHTSTSDRLPVILMDFAFMMAPSIPSLRVIRYAITEFKRFVH